MTDSNRPSCEKWWRSARSVENIEFKWSGEYEASSLPGDAFEPISFPFVDEDDESATKPSLIVESLERAGKLVVGRDAKDVKLDEQITPKLSSKESIISILQNEDSISGAFRGMDSILFVDHSEEHRTLGEKFHSSNRD